MPMLSGVQQMLNHFSSSDKSVPIETSLVPSISSDTSSITENPSCYKSSMYSL